MPVARPDLLSVIAADAFHWVVRSVSGLIL